MSSPLLPNRYYHIYNRGNNKEDLFYQKKNYSFFLNKYYYYCFPVLNTYAFCLMKNHFHLLVSIRTEEEVAQIISEFELPFKEPCTASRQLAHFFNSYAQSINKQEERTGSLFTKNFRRKEVENENYFLRLVRYIHWNPQLHGFIDSFQNYPFSSYHSYLNPESQTPIIDREKTLSLFGGIDNFLTVHNQIENTISVEHEFDSES